LGSEGVESVALVEGLTKLRNASMLFIVSFLLFGVGGLALFVAHWFVAVVVAVLMLVSAVIALVALFAYLSPSFSKLREYDEPSFGTPSRMVTIGYVVGFALLIVAPAVLLSMRSAGGLAALVPFLAVLLIAMLFILVGQIGLAVGMFRLRDRLGEALFLAAGILFIIGIVISVLNFVAWILVYVATGSVLRRMTAKTLQSSAH